MSTTPPNPTTEIQEIKAKKGGFRAGAGRKKGVKIAERTFTARVEDIEILKEIKAITGESLRHIFARLVRQEYDRLGKK